MGKEKEESRINLTSAGRNNFSCKLMPLMATSQTIPTQTVCSLSSCVAGGAVAPIWAPGEGRGRRRGSPCTLSVGQCWIQEKNIRMASLAGCEVRMDSH